MKLKGNGSGNGSEMALGMTGGSELVVEGGWLAGSGTEAIAGAGSSMLGSVGGDATGSDLGGTSAGDSVLSPSCVMAKAAKRWRSSAPESGAPAATAAAGFSAGGEAWGAMAVTGARLGARIEPVRRGTGSEVV